MEQERRGVRGSILCKRPAWNPMAAKTINLNDKALLLRFFQIGFHSIVRSFSESAPRIWYASLFAKPRGRYQPVRENSKIIYKVGNWHLLPCLAVPSFLAAVTTWLPHSRYWLVYWMWIRTCFSSLLFDVALECTPIRYTKIPITAGREGWPFRWWLWVPAWQLQLAATRVGQLKRCQNFVQQSANFRRPRWRR